MLYNFFDLLSASDRTLVFSMIFWTLTRLMALPILAASILLALAACAAVPVQEMSDARQAIYSAEAAGAAQRSSDTLLTAQRLLRDAQERLEAGAYDEARRYALDARDAAIRAREQATGNVEPRPAP
jgi:prophage DNA circulation protein